MRGSANAEKYPELLADLADQTAEILIHEGIAAERAADIGFRVAEHARRNWGGQGLYMPKGLQWALEPRDLEIFNKHNGRNTAQLAKEHGISEVRVYQICKAVKAREVDKRQGKLL